MFYVLYNLKSGISNWQNTTYCEDSSSKSGPKKSDWPIFRSIVYGLPVIKIELFYDQCIKRKLLQILHILIALPSVASRQILCEKRLFVINDFNVK